MIEATLTLIAKTYERDDKGVRRPTETPREVFCRVRNVSRNEFFEGGRNGLNPEYQMRVFFADYQGEAVAEYEGDRFSIYRTYRDGDYMELYLQREGGTNGSN